MRRYNATEVSGPKQIASPNINPGRIVTNSGQKVSSSFHFFCRSHAALSARILLLMYSEYLEFGISFTSDQQVSSHTVFKFSLGSQLTVLISEVMTTRLTLYFWAAVMINLTPLTAVFIISFSLARLGPTGDAM